MVANAFLVANLEDWFLSLIISKRPLRMGVANPLLLLPVSADGGMLSNVPWYLQINERKSAGMRFLSHLSSNFLSLPSEENQAEIFPNNK